MFGYFVPLLLFFQIEKRGADAPPLLFSDVDLVRFFKSHERFNLQLLPYLASSLTELALLDRRQ